MERILGGEGTGKTRKLIELAKNNNGFLVCEFPDRMRVKEHAYGITGVNIISYLELLLLPQLGKKVYIDDLDKFAKFISKDIAGYTLSID